MWKDVLGHPEPIFSLRNPGLVTIPLSFVVAVAVSLARRETLAEVKFAEVSQRIAAGAAVEIGA